MFHTTSPLGVNSNCSVCQHFSYVLIKQKLKYFTEYNKQFSIIFFTTWPFTLMSWGEQSEEKNGVCVCEMEGKINSWINKILTRFEFLFFSPIVITTRSLLHNTEKNSEVDLITPECEHEWTHVIIYIYSLLACLKKCTQDIHAQTRKIIYTQNYAIYIHIAHTV